MCRIQFFCFIRHVRLHHLGPNLNHVGIASPGVGVRANDGRGRGGLLATGASEDIQRFNADIADPDATAAQNSALW